jgi:hypothetical protein
MNPNLNTRPAQINLSLKWLPYPRVVQRLQNAAFSPDLGGLSTRCYAHRWNEDVPCAHIAAPTRLDIEKINPTMGMLSRSAAAKPNTEEPE